MGIYETDMKYTASAFFFIFVVQLFQMVSIYYISYVQGRYRKYTLYLS